MDRSCSKCGTDYMTLKYHSDKNHCKKIPTSRLKLDEEHWHYYCARCGFEEIINIDQKGK